MGYTDYSDRTVAGLCPMGCGETLHLGAGGHITCSKLKCPKPDAASRILIEQEVGHIVEVQARDFSMQHPLAERLDGELFDCGLNRYLCNLTGAPVDPGRWRVTGSGTDWRWERLESLK